MDKIDAIKNRIQSLTRAELSRLRSWFLEYDTSVWDYEIEADTKAGKLDGLADLAIKEHEAGESRPL